MYDGIRTVLDITVRHRVESAPKRNLLARGNVYTT